MSQNNTEISLTFIFFLFVLFRFFEAGGGNKPYFHTDPASSVHHAGVPNISLRLPTRPLL